MYGISIRSHPFSSIKLPPKSVGSVSIGYFPPLEIKSYINDTRVENKRRAQRLEVINERRSMQLL